jgi:PAS domain S-box-containing protein
MNYDFDILFENLPDGIVVYESTGKIIKANKRVEELLGLSRDQLFGLVWVDPMWRTIKDDGSDFPEDEHPGMKTLKTGKSVENEVMGVFNPERKDWVWLEVSSFAQFGGEKNSPEQVYAIFKDITKLMDKRRRQNQLLQILEQIPMSIVVTDLDGKIEYVNQVLEKNLGFKAQDLTHQNANIWKSGLIPELHYEELWEAIRRSEIWHGEFENVHRDGRRILESSTVFAIYDDNGKMINLGAIQENITTRKNVESELTLFKNVFENSLNGQLIIHEDRIIYGNDNFSKMVGLNSIEIQTYNFTAFLSAKSLGTFGLLMKRVLRSENALEGEFELINKGRGSIPVLAHMSKVLSQDGQSTFVAISVIDISERKQIENEIVQLNLSLEEKVRNRTQALALANNQLNAFFESSIDLLCIASQDGYFVKLSNSFKTILGYELSELLNQPYIQFIHPDDRLETSEKMNELNAQQNVFKFVNRYRAKNGEYRNIEWYASPVGEFIYAVARDVTDSIEQNRRLIEAREQAEFANAQKSKFLSRMSHELRTPMNSILGFAQLLEMSEMNQMQESAVNHILKSGKHLLEMINEVLEITRIESGNISLSIEPVNITQLCKEVCDLLDPMAKENDVNLILHNSFNSELYVKADLQRTKQIITNLINNGIKYNVPGGHVQLIQHRWMSSENIPIVRLTVRDSGVGIDENEIIKLFEPFQRIHAENSTIEGTGLGLSVVKELVEVLGGKVGVESEKGKGSTFWIDLPECDRTAMDIKLDSGDDNTSELESANDTSNQILYIEDNPSNVLLLKEIFAVKRQTFGLRIATNGADGLNELKSNPPDLVLLDLDLPDLHGSIVLEFIRSHDFSKNIPVVIVSADATKEKIDMLIELGANDYITKPFEVNELLRVIDSYLNKNDDV